MAFSLTVQVLDSQGSQIQKSRFDRFPIRIGRGEPADLLLAEETLSRQQFVVELDEERQLLKVRNLSERCESRHQGVVFRELELKLDQEAIIEAGGLRFRLLPSEAAQSETRIFDWKSLAAQQAAGADPVSQMSPASAAASVSDITPAPRVATAQRAPILVASVLITGLLGGAVVHLSRQSGTGPRSLSQGELIDRVQNGIFEVVIPKEEDAFVKYSRELPLDKLSFRERTDKFISIGTAFLMQDGRLASAEHVFGTESDPGGQKFYIRSAQGSVHAVTQVEGLSTATDLIVFRTESLPEGARPLPLQESTQVGDTVFTAGNAQGEGLALRSGVISSFTLEPLDGAWKHLRYSAPASPGNSGGPLLNSAGEVVGVVVMKNSGENLNYAVPIDRLQRLSRSEAEFVQNDIVHKDQGETLRSERERLVLSLPLEVGELARRASQARYQFVMGLREKFKQTHAARLFPSDPALLRRLIELTPGSEAGFQALTKDAGGTWILDGPVGKTKELEDGLVLWGGRPDESSDMEMYFDLRLPPERGISALWRDSVGFFERIARELHLKRNVAGEDISIVSYGEPHESERWVDSHGRAWRFSFWRTRHDRASLVFACTPYPSSIFCGMYQMGSHAEPYARSHLKQFLERVARVDHYGSLTQWKDYLALGADWVPRAIAESSLDLGSEGGSRVISLNARGREFRFKCGFGEKTALSLDLLWEPRDPSHMQIRTLTWNERFKDHLMASSYAVYFRPVEGSSQGYSEFWKNLIAGEGKFNSKPQADGGVRYIAHIADLAPGREPGDHVWGAQCAFAGGLDESVGRRFLEDCLSAQGFKALSRGRAPASVGESKK